LLSVDSLGVAVNAPDLETGALPQRTPSQHADFLNGPRLRAWCRILAACLVVTIILEAAHYLAGHGDPIGADFVSYWTAARMALTDPASVYDKIAHAAAEHAALAMPPGTYFPFFYPPIFLLACLPLALLPYWWSLLAFTVVGLSAFVAIIRRLLPAGWGVLPILSFPAVLVTAGTGQNGFISASLFGGYMLLVETRPVLAAICLGGMAYKPHLAIAIPVALIAARRWVLLLVTGATALGLAVLSWLLLGTGPWRGFLNDIGDARLMIEGGMLDQSKMQGVFTAARMLHAGIATAYAIQAGIALVVFACLAVLCFRRPGARAEAAAMSVAAMLCTPYLVDYDLPLLAPAMAWLAAEACRFQWRPGEKYVLLAAYLLPLLARGVALRTGLVIAPLVMAALFLAVSRRAIGAATQP
jgi:alpha-1,2-mannosyltransferase